MRVRWREVPGYAWRWTLAIVLGVAPLILSIETLRWLMRQR